MKKILACGNKSSKKRNVFLLLCLLALASCMTPDLASWPETIPAQQVFAVIYADDRENQKRQSQTEYLEWVLSFYQGNLAYQSGWLDIADYLIEAPDEAQDMNLMAQLQSLGVAIGSEWSKHNDVRLIDTRMLSLWGSTIQLASDYQQQRQSIEAIVEDVERILSGDLAEEEILDTRYDHILGLDDFGTF